MKKEFLNTSFDFDAFYTEYLRRCNLEGVKSLTYPIISRRMYPEKSTYHLTNNKLQKPNVRWTFQEISILAKLLNFELNEMKEYFK